MKSNYKRLGDYIKPVKVLNSDLRAKELLGINIDKFFMPSVANVVGTDLSRYKIVEKNQFACNRMHVGRDYRIPIALSYRDKPFMVSPAYDVFEIKDTSILHPEYLMMWFSRAEFDRNAWFYTDADVRGGLAWKAFCEMQLPVPNIDKQREIVKEYNTIVNRIKLNEQLNQKLEETAQAIYKHWFVDFEFPDENGKPYKSSGGEMVWNEESGKEIPEGWEVDSFGNHADFSQGIQVDIDNQYFEKEDGFNRFLRIVDYNHNTEEPARYVNINDDRYYCKQDEIAMVRYGSITTGKVCRRLEGIIANNLFKIMPKSKLSNSFCYYFLSSKETQKSIQGSFASSTMPAITHATIKDLIFVVPNGKLLISFAKIDEKFENYIITLNTEFEKLMKLKDLVLSKMTKVETEKEIV